MRRRQGMPDTVPSIWPSALFLLWGTRVACVCYCVLLCVIIIVFLCESHAVHYFFEVHVLRACVIVCLCYCVLLCVIVWKPRRALLPTSNFLHFLDLPLCRVCACVCVCVCVYVRVYTCVCVCVCVCVYKWERPQLQQDLPSFPQSHSLRNRNCFMSLLALFCGVLVGLWCARRSVVCSSFCGVLVVLWCARRSVVCSSVCGVLVILWCALFCGVCCVLVCATWDST